MQVRATQSARLAPQKHWFANHFILQVSSCTNGDPSLPPLPYVIALRVFGSGSLFAQLIFFSASPPPLRRASLTWDNRGTVPPRRLKTFSGVILMPNVLAAVTGSLGNKSSDSDLIKHTWPTRWGAWMGHAPLSSHKPSRLDFSAPAGCGQNQSPNRCPTPATNGCDGCNCGEKVQVGMKSGRF